jgi:hypothetical protein
VEYPKASRNQRHGERVRRIIFGRVSCAENRMRNDARTTICAAVIACVATATAQEGDDDLAGVRESLAQTIADSTTHAAVFDANGFHVESADVEELGSTLRPNGARFQMLSVTADGVFKVGIEKGRAMSTGGGVAVFHRESGWPMVSLGDRNGDGAVDILTYSVLDENGAAVLDIVDYEADGQPDMRMNFEEHYSELWHIDRWYRTELRDGRRGIVVGGEFVELRRGDDRWIVP